MYKFTVFVALAISLRFTDSAVVVNPASGYSRWPNYVIPIKTNLISNAYPEYPVLTMAMNQISLDLGYCINFTIYSTAVNLNQANLVAQNKFTNPSTPSDMCWTYPGYTAAGGTNGQVVIVFGATSYGGTDPGGCLDNQRDAMRILVNALGLRNEYMRADRDTYMVWPTTVDRNSLVASVLQKYNIFSPSNQYNSSVATQLSAFDYNSITMVTGARFAGTSTPVFTLPIGQTVGQQARLSIQDCNALKLLYGCPPSGYGPTPSCTDPYSSASSSVTLSPSPSVITRTLQCTTGTSNILTNTASTLAAFAVNGIPCSTTNPQAMPTITVTPSITGLNAVLQQVQSPLIVGSTSNNLLTGGTACTYILQFTYNVLPTKGQLNTQLTVNFASTSATGVVTTSSVPVTLNINCAPQFQSMTAFQVGQAPVLANAVTKTVGGSSPNNILVASSTNPVAAATFSGTTNSAAGASPSTTSTLLPYMVQYQTEFGVSGLLYATGGTPYTPPITKVFVNCVGSSTTSPPTLTAGGYGPLAGTTVVGSVSAIDPEGGNVNYYIWSENVVPTSTVEKQAGERWSITPNGIITVSAIAPVISGTAATSANQAPSSTIPGDTNASPISISTSAKTATSASTDDATGFTPRDVVISAIDSSGGLSTLVARLYLSCGPTSTSLVSSS